MSFALMVSHRKEIRVVKDRELSDNASLIGSDRYHDLAIIKCNKYRRNGPLKKIDYDKIKIGQECFVLGYPSACRI